MQYYVQLIDWTTPD